jgi:hypothetical protein
MNLIDLGGRIDTPWNDDIIVHFQRNLNGAMNTFIHIAHDSGLDYLLYTDYAGYELSEEYTDTIKTIYGKDFERGNYGRED